MTCSDDMTEQQVLKEIRRTPKSGINGFRAGDVWQRVKGSRRCLCKWDSSEIEQLTDRVNKTQETLRNVRGLKALKITLSTCNVTGQLELYFLDGGQIITISDKFDNPDALVCTLDFSKHLLARMHVNEAL